MPGARNRLRARPWDVVATELIDEIVAAAERIAAARALSGQRVFPDDAESRLLRAVAGSSYCLAIADVARALRITGQAAHKLEREERERRRVEREERERRRLSRDGFFR
jgi:hypothetical protein